MKTILNISALAVLLLVAPSPCFGDWGVEIVSQERAKELGLEVRTTATGPNGISVQLEFKTEGQFEEFSPQGKLKDLSRVELRIGEGNNPLVTAPLREDRSKPGRVVVSFSADRAQLDQINLCVMVPARLGGAVYRLQVKDFVELKKDR